MDKRHQAVTATILGFPLEPCWVVVVLESPLPSSQHAAWPESSNKYIFLSVILFLLCPRKENLFTVSFFGALLGCRYYTWTFSSCDDWRLLSSWGSWPSHCSSFSPFGAQLKGEQSSVAVALGLGCPTACGVSPDQEWNPHPLQRQVDS